MQQKSVYCGEEISIDEEAWSLGEPQNKCKLCREDSLRGIEHIRRRGGFKAVFGDEENRPKRSL